MKNILTMLLFILFFAAQISAQEVSINVNGCTLKGTLEVPASDKPVDVVMIIAGSGPTDRNGNQARINCNAYKMLAELFLKNNIASLRFDKRGIGASGKVAESELTFETYINDAAEWIKFLKNDKRFGKIIVAGHSEGSLIGMVASERTGADKYISICGAGKPIYQILDEQVVTKSKLPEELTKVFRTTIDSLKQGHLVKNVNPAFIALFRKSIQPYMISWFKFNPCAEIVKLKVPVLLIGGTTDLQVEAEDAKLLSMAKPDAKLAIIENMNHVLKNVPDKERTANLKSYNEPELPLSEGFCKALLEFLSK